MYTHTLYIYTVGHAHAVGGSPTAVCTHVPMIGFLLIDTNPACKEDFLSFATSVIPSMRIRMVCRAVSIYRTSPYCIVRRVTGPTSSQYTSYCWKLPLPRSVHASDRYTRGGCCPVRYLSLGQVMGHRSFECHTKIDSGRRA